MSAFDADAAKDLFSCLSLVEVVLKAQCALSGTTGRRATTASTSTSLPRRVGKITTRNLNVLRLLKLVKLLKRIACHRYRRQGTRARLPLGMGPHIIDDELFW